jgi:DNA-binding winged helix-turn-helix (wHTH) protein
MITTLILTKNEKLMDLVSLLISGCLEHRVIKEPDISKAIDIVDETKPDVVLFDEDFFLASPSLGELISYGAPPLFILLTEKRGRPSVRNYIPIPDQDTVAFFLTALRGMINASLEIKVNGWSLNMPQKSVRKKDAPEIPLSDNEIALLYVLMVRPDSIHGGNELIKAAWGENAINDWVIDSSTLRKAIQGLRRKLGQDAIVNIHGKGYKLNMQ